MNKIGDTTTYPSSREWVRSQNLEEHAVATLLANVPKNVVVGLFVHQTVERWLEDWHNETKTHWLNKLACVVNITPTGMIQAVYYHDFGYYLIQKQG